jgi:hydroxymethylcytosylglucuronate/cytosylglucuronate synthase
MEKPTVRDKPTVTVAACDFGWGSVGKLRLILDELNCIFEDRIAIFAEPQSFDLLSRIMPGRVEKRRIDGQRVDLGLVINDPRHADELSDSGVPVIYVDSLPYLWTLQDEVPRVVEVYCAQRYPGHGSQLKNGPLEHRPDVVWIDPIVPCPRIRTARGGVVINVGGLHSHLAQQSVGAYQEVVVLPLVRMLVSGGHQISAICGNLDHRIVRELRSLVPAGTTVGIHTGDEFEEVLVDASLLLTSPGSTTILQAASMNLPTALLPPQNLSQILNAEIFSGPQTAYVRWPESVLDRNKVDGLRSFGEDVVIEYIYESIVAAASSVAARASIERALERCVTFAACPQATLLHLLELGRFGALNVSEIIAGRLAAEANRPAGSLSESMGTSE